jgi:wyosine [tRNA(Phe)-imidazoG37] synthetase (radical SAM superfamily)
MSTTKTILTPQDHDRDSAGMTYVYPVVSRRAKGVSIGINLNPNNACNWRCIYCQVPDLTRGAAPEIDLTKLEDELRTMLHDALYGNFMRQRVPEEARRLEDIAFSGNGEPTSSAEFGAAIAIVEHVLREFDLLGKLTVRLITNGSLIEKPGVLDAIRHLGQINGEVWFKVDAATTDGIARINDVRLNPQRVVERLQLCSQACPTWVQTCVFALDGKPPSAPEIAAYIELLQQTSTTITGVHLYGLARPSMQAEASRLSRLSEDWMHTLADRIRERGITVHVSP